MGPGPGRGRGHWAETLELAATPAASAATNAAHETDARFRLEDPPTVGAGLAFSWTSTGALVGYWAAIILLT